MSELTFAQKQQSRAGSHPVMQQKAIHNSGFVSNVPPIVHEVLQSPGQSWMYNPVLILSLNLV